MPLILFLKAKRPDARGTDDMFAALTEQAVQVRPHYDRHGRFIPGHTSTRKKRAPSSPGPKLPTRKEAVAARVPDLFADVGKKVAAAPKVAEKPKAAAPAKPKTFTPTHEAADGTPLAATAEAGVYVDADGFEVEDEYAKPLKAESPADRAKAEIEAAFPQYMDALKAGDHDARRVHQKAIREASQTFTKKELHAWKQELHALPPGSGKSTLVSLLDHVGDPKGSEVHKTAAIEKLSPEQVANNKKLIEKYAIEKGAKLGTITFELGDLVKFRMEGVTVHHLYDDGRVVIGGTKIDIISGLHKDQYGSTFPVLPQDLIENAKRSGSAYFKKAAIDARTGAAGPKDGERNSQGLVFRGGRWHRDEEKPTQSVFPVEESKRNAEYRANRGDEVMRIDAKAFADAYLRDKGEPLLWKPGRADNIRELLDAGMAIDEYPKVGVSADGKVDVGDGRHRIAVAAERGMMIDVAAPKEHLERLRSLIAKLPATDRLRQSLPPDAPPAITEAIGKVESSQHNLAALHEAKADPEEIKEAAEELKAVTAELSDGIRSWQDKAEAEHAEDKMDLAEALRDAPDAPETEALIARVAGKVKSKKPTKAKAKPDPKDAALQAAVDHLEEDAKQGDLPEAEKREDAALVAKLKEAIEPDGPREGDRNAEGLVFRGGRWRGVGSAPSSLSDVANSAKVSGDAVDAGSGAKAGVGVVGEKSRRGRTHDHPEVIRQRRMGELRNSIELMRTMPEGAPLPGTPDREMTERRRARYVREGEECLAAAESMDAERLFRLVGDSEYLFHDALMD